ncbi:hypothetical protein BCEN4_170059 [Burkholderia cenocepacia]|nr:hypothetical protein BCEN4_170059 [Burkholderia cenocepacia]
MPALEGEGHDEHAAVTPSLDDRLAGVEKPSQPGKSRQPPRAVRRLPYAARKLSFSVAYQ